MSKELHEQLPITKNEAGRDEREYPVTPRLSPAQKAAKRTLDFIFALAVMPALGLLTAVIGLIMRLESEGPIFYKQTRIGKDGKPFKMFKYRSMYKDADKRLAELKAMNEASGPVFKIKNDPRVTKVGSVLRRTSLDELPQFINVLKGEMSLVGPRPPLPNEVAEYNDHQWGRLAVIPGLTCLWQISGRSDVSFDNWVELDLEYIRKQSFWLDIKLILKTIPAIIRGTGAY